MNVSRHAVAKILVRPLVIVELEVVVESGGQVRYRSVLLDVDILVLDRAPEPLNEDVIEDPTAAIHADTNACHRQLAGEITRSELNALVSVEDFRLAMVK